MYSQKNRYCTEVVDFKPFAILSSYQIGKTAIKILTVQQQRTETTMQDAELVYLFTGQTFLVALTELLVKQHIWLARIMVTIHVQFYPTLYLSIMIF